MEDVETVVVETVGGEGGGGEREEREGSVVVGRTSELGATRAKREARKRAVKQRTVDGRLE
jgi:hypothetical protein